MKKKLIWKDYLENILLNLLKISLGTDTLAEPDVNCIKISIRHTV